MREWDGLSDNAGQGVPGGLGTICEMDTMSLVALLCQVWSYQLYRLVQHLTGNREAMATSVDLFPISVPACPSLTPPLTALLSLAAMHMATSRTEHRWSRSCCVSRLGTHTQDPAASPTPLGQLRLDWDPQLISHTEAA